MRGNVGVSLFVSLVLFDEVQVIHADDDGAVHFGRLDNAGQDPTSDGDVTGEWALFVDVVAFDGLFRSLKAQTNVLVVTGTRFTRRFLFRRCGETVIIKKKERGKEVSKHRRRERSNEVQNSPSPKQSENSWLPIHVTHTLKRILSQLQEQRISVQKEYRVRERWKHKKRIPKRPYSLKMRASFSKRAHHCYPIFTLRERISDNIHAQVHSILSTIHIET